jgi:hypothetical protein
MFARGAGRPRTLLEEAKTRSALCGPLSAITEDNLKPLPEGGHVGEAARNHKENLSAFLTAEPSGVNVVLAAERCLALRRLERPFALSSDEGARRWHFRLGYCI